MKKYFNFSIYVILLAFVITFTACSSEDAVVVEQELSEENVLTDSSNITKLIENTVSNDGSFDNIIDRSSCFDISFPYKVMVDGIEITINSVDDLQLIETIFDAIETDDDVLDIIFPVNITMADYAEITINSIEELKSISDKCIEGGSDDDIECIDVIYPVTLFVYSKSLEQTNSVTVNKDKELALFFAGLDETDLLSVQFPVMFEMHDGAKITVNNNEELESVLELAQDICDEDDDSDYNDDDFSKEQLDSLLVDCLWVIDDIERGDYEDIFLYVGYKLSFTSDGHVAANDKAGTIYSGSWKTAMIDYQAVLTVDFEFLDVFNSEWFVYDIEQGKIKLHLNSDDNKIILYKTCEEQIIECTEAFVKDTLQNCLWSISEDSGVSFVDETKIDFSGMNLHVEDLNGDPLNEGYWTIEKGVISLNNLSDALYNYNGDWSITECSAVRLKLARGDEYLVLEKDCE